MIKKLSFYLQLFRNNAKWILFSTALFFIGIGFGYIAFLANPEGVLEATQEAFKTLKNLAEEIQQASFLRQVTIIFQQNLFSTTFIMLMGAFFGLIPFFVIWANGSIIGILLAIAQQENALWLFAYGILPHAVFEIPAVILAAAWGMKLGHKTFLLLFSFLFPKSKKFPPSVWRKTFNEAGFVWLLVFILLLVAAFVEIGVTGNLLNSMIEN